MALTTVLGVCCVHPKNDHRVTMHLGALGTDIVIGAAITAIALLGIFGIIPMSSSLSHALAGVGSAYLGISLAFVIAIVKGSTDCTRKLYLIGKDTWSSEAEQTEGVKTVDMRSRENRDESKKPYNPDAFVMRGVKPRAGYAGGQ